MLSIRKSMEMEETLQCTLRSYGDALVAAGQAAARSCPPVGENIEQASLNLRQRLSAEPAPGLIVETERTFEKELHEWSDQAAQFYEEKTNEVKEILAILAKAAAEVLERDRRYTNEFGALAENLQATAKLDALTLIRQSLVKNVVDLTTCVTKMGKDGRESVVELRAQMKVYESRLEEVERIALQDELTGLANRRKVERQIESRLRQGLPLCVLYFDLNGFKKINDTFGHASGDELLKLFARELRTAFSATDVVGRWGGDEFIVLIHGDYREGMRGVERIKKWVAGEYSITTESGPQKVNLAVAIGIACCEPGDTPAKILRRADDSMYEHKAKSKRIA